MSSRRVPAPSLPSQSSVLISGHSAARSRSPNSDIGHNTIPIARMAAPACGGNSFMAMRSGLGYDVILIDRDSLLYRTGLLQHMKFALCNEMFGERSLSADMF